MVRLARPLGAVRPRYDAVVVGSGYGGGVAAARLARMGHRVCVLERGREFHPGDFPSRFSDMRGEVQVTGSRVRTGRETALYDVRLGEDMHVLVGCGLGGGSLINAGVALRPDPRVFAGAAWPDEFREDGTLDEGYQRAEAWLRPASDPQAADHAKYRALRTAGETLGLRTIAPRVMVSFEETVSAGGVRQPACTRCGDCCAGCNLGAKNTVAVTYLPDAHRHGAEIFTHAKVSLITKAGDGGWRVHARTADAPANGEDRDFIIEAPMVVLAAGTLGTTEILLRSRDNGLELSDRVGQRFSANGDIIAFGYGAAAPVNAVGVGYPPKLTDWTVGACVSGQIEIEDRGALENELCIQEGVLPSALAPMLPVLFVPNGRLLGALSSLISGVYKGPFARLQTFFAVSHDSASGRFRLEDDRLRLSWPGAKDEPVYGRLDAILTSLVEAAGGEYVKNPLSGTVMGHQPATAHPLGGAGMGQDAAEGVVNHKCQVFANAVGGGAVHEGLHVMDGSVIPRSLGVNPLLTITALAERAMLHFERR